MRLTMLNLNCVQARCMCWSAKMAPVKSTLMKVLADIYQPDGGRILYNNTEVTVPNPRAAQHLGISMIHQELNLMPHLTVAQNVFIGREPRQGVRFMLNEKEINAKTQALLPLCI